MASIPGTMTTSAETDYWSLLGLTPDADQESLKRAFRREARRWHPDLNGNDLQAEERFKLVNEAYAVLSNPERKTEWIRLREGQAVGVDPFSTGFPEFEEYLDVVLGSRGNRRSGADKDDPRNQKVVSSTTPATGLNPPHHRQHRSAPTMILRRWLSFP